MVTPESTGLDIVYTIFMSFIDTLISDFGRVIIDDIVVGVFEAIFGTIFGGGLSVELTFLLIFSLVLFGIFYRYIYTVVN